MIDLDGKRVDKKDDDDGKEKKHEIGTDFGLKTDQVRKTTFWRENSNYSLAGKFKFNLNTRFCLHSSTGGTLP